jgi:hypothetical protein
MTKPCALLNHGTVDAIVRVIAPPGCASRPSCAYRIRYAPETLPAVPAAKAAMAEGGLLIEPDPVPVDAGSEYDIYVS